MLEKAGLTREKLPFLYKYSQKTCTIMGYLATVAKKERGVCKLKHPRHDEVGTPGFAQELVSKLKPGVDRILEEGLPPRANHSSSKRQKFGY